MRVFRYPVGSLLGDYIRSAVGLIVGLGVLLSVPWSPAIVLVFGGLLVLFSVFGWRTVQRHIMQVAITDTEIRSATFGAQVLNWADLEGVKLRFYGSRRQQKSGDGGFMQLTLRGGGTKLTFESNLEGFDYIAWRTTKAARSNGVSLDPTSAGNFLAIGVDADGEGPEPKASEHF